MKQLLAILLAVCITVTIMTVSLMSTHANSDKSITYEKVGASQSAEKVGASQSAEKVGASQPDEEVGASVPPTNTYEPINSIYIRDGGKNDHLCEGGSVAMERLSENCSGTPSKI